MTLCWGQRSFIFIRIITVSFVAYLGGAGLVQVMAAAPPIPPAPSSYVLDEPQVLQPQQLQSLQSLLAAHDQKTGEQFVIAVFNSLNGEDLSTWTNRVFQAWKIGKRGKDNGVLLALYWNDHKMRIEVGYGLEPLLTDVQSKRIIDYYLVPNLKQGKPDQALISAAVAILQVIHSPLIQNGEIQNWTRNGIQGRPISQADHRLLAMLLCFGLIILFVVVNFFQRGNADYTSDSEGRSSGKWGALGYFLSLLFFSGFRRRGYRDDDWGGGGGPGGGDDDSFRGGGGSSGGGGANGGW